MRFRKPEMLLLLICVFLAFCLRLYRLDGHEIWGDEAYSITIAGWPLARAVSGNVDTHPPLYYALLWITVRVIGTSPFAVRFPSTLAGLIVVPLMYRLGRALDRRTGLIAAILTAISPFLIYYSQEARMYALSLAGATGSILAFWMLWQRQQNSQPISPGLWGLYALASLAAIYSHYYAFAVLLAEATFLVVMAAKSRKPSYLAPWLVLWLGMALCFLPWLLEHRRFLQGKASARFSEWSLTKFGEIAARTLLACAVGKTLPPEIRPWGWGIVGIGGVGIINMAVRKHGQMLLFHSFVLLTALVFAWAVNPLMPFFEERYLLICTPPFLLLVAAGLPGKKSRYLWSGLGMLAILSLNGISFWHYHFDPAFRKGEYGSLMAGIANQGRAGDLILLNNPLQASLFEYYHPEGIPYRFIPPGALLTDEETERFFSEAIAGYRRVWLVDFGNPQEYDPIHRARAWLARHAYLGLRRDYLGATLSLFILEAPAQITHPMNVQLGDEIRLRGYSLETDIGHPGESLLVTLYWEALRPTSRS
ncbi:MAG: glycosyltransferase family 39 protein, partial [Anaerolineae bacterium]